jgi:lipoate-protein ligase A
MEGRSKSEIVENDELVASIHNQMLMNIEPEEVLKSFSENRTVLKERFEDLLREVVERKESMLSKKREMEEVIEVLTGYEEKARHIECYGRA